MTEKQVIRVLSLAVRAILSNAVTRPAAAAPTVTSIFIIESKKLRV